MVCFGLGVKGFCVQWPVVCCDLEFLFGNVLVLWNRHASVSELHVYVFENDMFLFRNDISLFANDVSALGRVFPFGSGVLLFGVACFVWK